VDTDQDWDDERPQQGRGSNRLFLFLLLFHIFLIGSVVLYNLVSERPKPVFVDSSAPPKKTTPATPNATSPAGQTPAPGAVAAQTERQTVEHRVAQGDSLKSIADASGVTQEEIAAMNHIDVGVQLAVGSVLRVPPPKARPAPTVIPAAVQPARVEDKVVSVQPTTAAETARMFAAVEPAPAPRKAEPVTDNPPEDKPKSKVEDSPPPAVKPPMVVKVEDTPPPAIKPKPTEAKAIARPEPPPAPVAKVVEPPKAIEPPKTTPPPAKTTPPPATPKLAESGVKHTVKPKETFYSISRKYGVNVDELMRLNGMKDPGKLREGTVLKVPAK
jgi:LysM repeat protein